MPLELERFWAAVRSKKRRPRSPVPRKEPSSIEIWVEAVDSRSQNPCTPRVKVQLIPDSAGFKGVVSFPSFSREALVHGVNVYATRRAEPLFTPCEARQLFTGNTLIFTLYISDGPTLTRLKQLGLKISV